MMKNYILCGLLLFASGLSVYCALHGRKANAQVQTIQQVQTAPQVTHNLTIYDKKSPLKINSVLIREKAIANGQSFTEDNNWPKDLTVELSNTTGRIITFVQVSVIVGPINGVPFVFFMQKGRSPLHEDVELRPEAELHMLPGDYLSLKVDPGLIEGVKGGIAQRHANSPEVKVRVEMFALSDGSVWMPNKEVKRNPDSKSPIQWIPRFSRQQ